MTAYTNRRALVARSRHHGGFSLNIQDTTRFAEVQWWVVTAIQATGAGRGGSARGYILQCGGLSFLRASLFVASSF
jgi:hypothetical protein